MLPILTRTTTLGLILSLGLLVVFKKLELTVGAYLNSLGFMEIMLKNLLTNMATSLA